MTSNDNTTAQMLLFPIQEASNEELSSCFDTDVLYFQTRLKALKALNLVRVGKISLDEGLRKNFEDFNSLAKKTGYPQIAIDF
ncbi:MAG: hypothetical protein ACKVTZ_04230 [Bacteroidia bacterium]